MKRLLRARCISQPWMAWPMFLIFISAIGQLVLGPGGVIENIFDVQAGSVVLILLITGSFLGLVGLHWPDFERAIWLEIAGFPCLIGGAAIYCTAQITDSNTFTIGAALSSAVILASLHRGVQILAYKYHRNGVQVCRCGIRFKIRRTPSSGLDEKTIRSLIAMEKRYL